MIWFSWSCCFQRHENFYRNYHLLLVPSFVKENVAGYLAADIGAFVGDGAFQEVVFPHLFWAGTDRGLPSPLSPAPAVTVRVGRGGAQCRGSDGTSGRAP